MPGIPVQRAMVAKGVGDDPRMVGVVASVVEHESH